MTELELNLDFDELELAFDNNAFEGGAEFFTDESETSVEETRYTRPLKRRFRKEHEVFYENAHKLAIDTNLQKNSAMHVLLSGNFIFGDYIEALIFERDLLVNELTISTLSLSANNIVSLESLLKTKRVLKLNLIVSDMFFGHNRNTLVKLIYEELDKEGYDFQLSVCRTHTKIAFFDTEQGAKVVLHGSANLRSSDNLEQVCIEENEVLHDFWKVAFDGIIDHYKTINKSVKSRALRNILNPNPKKNG